MMESEEAETATGPRESMIATAVKFLQNPKVTQSPPSQKRTFLEKKGMTKEEIDLAFTQAGVSENAIIPSASHVVAMGTPGVVYQQPPEVSKWEKFRDYSATAIVSGGLLYGVYIVYKRYVMPLWYGPSPEERQLRALQKSIADLQENIRETLAAVREVTGAVTKQQESLDKATPPRRSEYEDRFVNEVKDEIKSLKGLLLSRKQFPPPPTTQPVLPAWQLAAKPEPSEKDTKHSDTKASDADTKASDADTKASDAEDAQPTTNQSPLCPEDAQPTPNQSPPCPADVAGGGEGLADTAEQASESVLVLPQDDEITEDAVQNLLNGHLTNGDLDTEDDSQGQSSKVDCGSTVTVKADVVVAPTEVSVSS